MRIMVNWFKGNGMKMFIDAEEVNSTWEDNDAVNELKKLASDEPITIKMFMYGGFEQVGDIGDVIHEVGDLME